MPSGDQGACGGLKRSMVSSSAPLNGDSTPSRWSVFWLALFGELSFVALAAVPLAPLAAFQMLYLGPKLTAVLFVVLLVILWYVVQPGAHRPHPDINPRDMSPLRELVDDLCKKADAPKIHNIVLTDELNAAALQTGGLASWIGVKRTLFLGVPLMHLLSLEEIKAVVSHEIGHFSRSHGFLAHWIYRIRYKWDDQLRYSSSGDRLDGFFNMIGRTYVPRFLKASFSISRACEFEADETSAALVSPDALISALMKIECASAAQQSSFRAEIHTACLCSEQPPSDYWSRFRTHLTSQPIDLSIVHRDEGEISSTTQWNDTHPSLQDRARHLGIELRTAAWTVPAGDDLFPSEWVSMIEDSNQRWTESARQSWRLRHLYLRWLQTTPPVDEPIYGSNPKLRPALHAFEFSADTNRLQDLRNLASDDGENAAIKFILGKTLLECSNIDGIPVLISAIRLDERIAAKASLLIYTYVKARGHLDLLPQAEKRYHHYKTRRQKYLSELRQSVLTSGLTPLPASLPALLKDALSHDVLIDGAWGGYKTISPESGRPATKVNLLFIRISTAELELRGWAESDVWESYSNLISGLTEPSEECIVMTYFNTEPLDPNLFRQIGTNPELEIVPPKTEVNRGVLKIDSL